METLGLPNKTAPRTAISQRIVFGASEAPSRAASNYKLPCRWPSFPTHIAHKQLRLSRCSASLQGGEETSESIATSPIPGGPDETVQQAFQAVRAAFQDGINRQLVEILLPLIGATDLDDWPGGIRQQLQAAAPMVEDILKGLKTVEGLQGRLDAEVLEEADCVVGWTGQNILAVLFPTADVLNQVQKRCEQKKLALLVNPEWRGGQVISDFGLFGRKQKEDFVASFMPSYCLKQYRLMGKDVRLLRCYPGNWQVHVVPEDGAAKCVAIDKERPSYKRIEDIVRGADDESGSGGLLDKMTRELKFNARSLKGP